MYCNNIPTNYIKGLVSVVMATYNTPEEYLRLAIESVLEQTYKDFEFIIIDDGSTDNSPSVIESYKDERIIVIKNSDNIGIPKSRNRGLDTCRGEYMAVMDSDDICFPNRFEEQVKYLNANDNVIACGTYAECIGCWEKYRSNKIIMGTIENRASYRVRLLLANRPLIVHPSAMLNRKLMLKNNIRYDERYSAALDYRLWVDCSKVADCVILPKTLLYYRVHEKSTTIARRNAQAEFHKLTIREQLECLNLEATEKVYEIHHNLIFNNRQYDLETKTWIKTIIKANKKNKVYDHHVLKSILWELWTKMTYYGIVGTDKIGIKAKRIAALPIFLYPKLVKISLSKWKHNRNN